MGLGTYLVLVGVKASFDLQEFKEDLDSLIYDGGNIRKVKSQENPQFDYDCLVGMKIKSFNDNAASSRGSLSIRTLLEKHMYENDEGEVEVLNVKFLEGF